MAIRWGEFPHKEIQLRIYARLRHNDVSRSEGDAERHILRRRLVSLDTDDHKRFVELEAMTLVEHLRCTRDVYQEYVDSKRCRPVLEAHWVVLLCAVFPTAIAILHKAVIEYAALSQVPLVALSVLFGLFTRLCYEDVGDGIRLLRCPDLADKSIASSEELESLATLVDRTHCSGSVTFGTEADATKRSRQRPGRPPRLSRAFVVCAGTLWRKTKTHKTRLSNEELGQIAREFAFPPNLQKTVRRTDGTLHRCLPLPWSPGV